MCLTAIPPVGILSGMSERSSDQILTQLKRIRGQLDGLIGMYDNQRACIDIVRQITAARSSLGRVARDLLTKEAVRCSRENSLTELDAVLREVFRY